MTLRLKDDGTLGTVLLLEAIREVPDPPSLALAHREKGLMLRDISSNPPEHSAVLSLRQLKNGNHTA